MWFHWKEALGQRTEAVKVVLGCELKFSFQRNQTRKWKPLLDLSKALVPSRPKQDPTSRLELRHDVMLRKRWPCGWGNGAQLAVWAVCYGCCVQTKLTGLFPVLSPAINSWWGQDSLGGRCYLCCVDSLSRGGEAWQQKCEQHLCAHTVHLPW